MNQQITHHYEVVNGIKIFYRTAGDKSKKTLVLFHGFPSSSHMFRDLMPKLLDDFYLIAPDYPAFGQSDIPSRDDFAYTFDNIADLMNDFLKQIGVLNNKFSMFVFDYGAPIGFRVALKNKDKIEAIISQNGNVYEEGLGPKWAQRAVYWKNPTKELREQYKSAFAANTIIGQYTFGTEDGVVSPDGYTLDIHYMSRDGEDEIQSDLIFDYQNNVKMYPEFQAYLREYQPPLLAVWGENDPSFIKAGALAFKKDLKNPQIHFVNSGHFALETHSSEIANYIKEFLNNL